MSACGCKKAHQLERGAFPNSTNVRRQYRRLRPPERCLCPPIVFSFGGCGRQSAVSIYCCYLRNSQQVAPGQAPGEGTELLLAVDIDRHSCGQIDTRSLASNSNFKQTRLAPGTESSPRHDTPFMSACAQDTPVPNLFYSIGNPRRIVTELLPHQNANKRTGRAESTFSFATFTAR